GSSSSSNSRQPRPSESRCPRLCWRVPKGSSSDASRIDTLRYARYAAPRCKEGPMRQRPDQRSTRQSCDPRGSRHARRYDRLFCLHAGTAPRRRRARPVSRSARNGCERSPTGPRGCSVERPRVPAGQARLEHEASLAAELDPRWAARPLQLGRHHGRTVLVLEDPGGVLQLVGPPFDLTLPPRTLPLRRLPIPLRIRFTVLEEKFVGRTVHEGQLTALCE